MEGVLISFTTVFERLCDSEKYCLLLKAMSDPEAKCNAQIAIDNSRIPWTS